MSATGTGGTHHQRVLAAVLAGRAVPRPAARTERSRRDAWGQPKPALWWEL